MRINRFYIKEFRNLREFSIDFASEGTPVTFNSHAIIGQNGSGKSNLLEAIIIIFRDLESVLFSLKRPYWFGSNPSEAIIQKGDNRFWYARGKVRDFLDKLWQYAVAPIDCEESRTVDFRDRKEKFELLYLFLPDEKALHGLANSFVDEATAEPTPVTFLKYLESTYISDLIDEVSIKVKHKNTEREKQPTEQLSAVLKL